MSEFKINGSLNEYAFARFVEGYNESVVEHGNRVITATQGRDLHAAVMKGLSEAKNADGNPFLTRTGEPYTFATAPRTLFTYVMGITTKQVTGISLCDGNTAQMVSDYNKYLQEFSDSIGWGFDKASADDRRHGNVSMNGYVPISPFDERYAMRSTVLSHGTEILYAKTSDMVQMLPTGSDEKGVTYSTFMAHDSIRDEKDVMLFQRQVSANDKEYFRGVGSAYTNEDASGLSRMRP